MNHHGQVRSPYHPRHKDECSSKLSVQRSFEKTLIDDTVTWWNWSPLCFSFTIPNSCSGNEHHHHHVYSWFSVLPRSATIVHPAKFYNKQHHLNSDANTPPNHTAHSQSTLKEHSYWSDGHEWSYMAVWPSGQVHQIGRTDPVQRAGAWGPQIARSGKK